MSEEIKIPETEIVTEKYDESSIQVLEGLEAVRKRPGMYIGSTGERGLHHLVYEIVDNSIDEALAGYCDKIEVDILDDGIIRVTDNGRGIPVGINPQKGIPTVTVVFTILHAGGKFGGSGYKVSGGLHGVGASVVNALSSWLEVEVKDGTHVYKQRYEKGNIVSELDIIGDTDETGTTVTFKPDPSIFTDTTEYNYDTLLTRLREQAFLNAGIRVVLTDKRTDAYTAGKTDDLCFEGGIKSYVEYLLEGTKKESLVSEVIYLSGKKGDDTAEIALLWSTAYDSKILSFANTLHTIDGGTHEQAFRQTVTRIVNKYAHDFKKIKDSSDNLKGDDILEGLVAVVSVKLADAQFESQTKAKLGNTSIGQLVRDVVNDQLYRFLEEHPMDSKIILDKAIAASNAREAAQKAREASRKESGMGKKSRMPEKLSDCISSDPKKTEIFIVEGDSAGGSAVEGRNSTYQAILPLWGKMLNVEKARDDKVYGNDKLTPVIVALGTGIGENFNIDTLRYDKIVIMADADVDGSHIRTLLLTFFFRYMPALIESGHIYLAQPPLFRVSKGKQHFDAFTDEEKAQYIEQLGGTADVQRYKGLGEMDPDQLWETTLDPERRTLLRVTMEDAALADETFTMLMGEEVEPRKQFIEENAVFATDLDI
ncbi:MAG: DNA topoisomerase (ATP-hydrolyzing) subunit B [Acutalibacteraceae bacterium]|nr:DNA topoisomerase (ATP-hydrolyzing) subunit B [Acutalibacteraceae bacterium]